MITLRSIKAVLTGRLKIAYPEYKVHFDNVDKANAPYFYVEMQPLITTVDEVYSDRTIQVDITFVPEEDAYGRADRMVLYDMGDMLDELIRPVLRVEDRAITIGNAEITIHDEVLHYIFNLVFADYREAKCLTMDLMEELELRLNEEE
ncbi:MAG: hypothetical protein LKI17_06360 [Megasphaera cerevisiae]|jgi:hypothetical protein|nr:hypothetical protein [Megasphaera cerevisiae]